MPSTPQLDLHNKTTNNISTLSRYVYLNSYAFLLLLLGGGIICLTIWSDSLYWLWLQIPISLFCWYGAFQILSAWSGKKRSYAILIERNNARFRPDTFTEYMQAPCGRLLVKIVLHDLGMPNMYKQLKAQHKFCLQINCKTTKIRVYVNPDYDKEM